MINLLRGWLSAAPSDDAGAKGEQQAAEWLRRERRFAVVARNWRNPADRRQEIDLVCRDGEVLVFVEVKARDADALVPGYFAVNDKKKKVLRKAIDAYLARLRPKPTTFRFDVVEVAHTSDGQPPTIRHFENVSLFSKYYRGRA